MGMSSEPSSRNIVPCVMCEVSGQSAGMRQKDCAGNSMGITVFIKPADLISALIKSAGLIKTVMPIELPAQSFCLIPADCPDTSHITQGTIFLLDGSLDIPISPPTQPGSATGLQSIAAFYNAVPAGIVKVKGTLIGPTHCDVQGSPNCTAATVPCLLG